MEIKINKEIREYTESIFFGLSLRQFLCSLSAVAAAVAVYFFLHDGLGTELIGWACVVAAIPFGLLGFVRYNGMAAEKIAVKFFQTMLLTPRFLPYKSENLYMELFKGRLAQCEKELRRAHDKDLVSRTKN